jgi:putative ABC transport system permease protein
MDPIPVIELTPWKLLLLVVPLAVLLAVAAAMKLGLSKRIGLAAGRAVVQLIAVGLVIGWVFAIDRWYWIVGLLIIMILIASLTAGHQIRGRWWRNSLALSAILGLVTGIMLLYVSEAVVGVGEWSARYLIPIGGMILGNAMTAAVLCAERIDSDLKQRWADVEAMVSLGATGRQAAADSLRKAVGAALTPTLNAMMIVGVVKLPGMMTGQMLGGTEPFQAAMYQLLILIAILTCDCLSAVVVGLMMIRRRFAVR